MQDAIYHYLFPTPIYVIRLLVYWHLALAVVMPVYA